MSEKYYEMQTFSSSPKLDRSMSAISIRTEPSQSMTEPLSGKWRNPAESPNLILDLGKVVFYVRFWRIAGLLMMPMVVLELVYNSMLVAYGYNVASDRAAAAMQIVYGVLVSILYAVVVPWCIVFLFVYMRRWFSHLCELYSDIRRSLYDDTLEKFSRIMNRVCIVFMLFMLGIFTYGLYVSC